MLKIGLLATLHGPYKTLGDEALRGTQMALNEFNHQSAGEPIELSIFGTNALAASVFEGVPHLFNEEQVDFVIGPLSGNEGIAMRDLAKQHPERAFINGIAGALDMTLRDPAPNFFSFSANGYQWVAGMGDYCYEEMGLRRMISIGEDYSFPHAQIGGFALQFCMLGGDMVDMLWCALGTTDYHDMVQTIVESDVDAIYLALGTSDALSFLQQYREATDKPLKIIAGTLSTDTTMLNSDPANATLLEGTISSGPLAGGDNALDWQQFLKTYRHTFPDGLITPSLIAHGYYLNVKAALLALKQVENDLSDGQNRFKQALNSLSFKGPTGYVRLDHNRNAICDIYIRETNPGKDGFLYNYPIQIIPEVSNAYAIPEDELLGMGTFNRHNMPCKNKPLDGMDLLLSRRKKPR